MKTLISLLLLLGYFLPAYAASAETTSQNLGQIWGTYYAGQALQDGCASAFPGDKARYDEVFGGWLARNHAIAEKTVVIFDASLQKMVTSEKELAEAKMLLQQLMANFELRARAEVDRLIGESSQAYCDSMANRLGSGEAELIDLFGTELEQYGISAP